jgi:hypothetical protein
MASHIAALGNIICVQSFLLRTKDARTKTLRCLGPVYALEAENEGGERDDVPHEDATFECAVSVFDWLGYSLVSTKART